MDEAGFDREYNSIWAGSLEGAFFDPNKFDQCRVLNIAEQRYNKGIPSKGYYVLGVDVGRYGFLNIGSYKISLIAGIP